MEAPLPDIPALVRRAIEHVGSQAKLAQRASERGRPITQQRISQLLKEDEITSDAALALHAATDGLVSASALRPDLWRRPEDVPAPVLQPEAAE